MRSGSVVWCAACGGLCEDWALDGPASGGKGSKGGPYKCGVQAERVSGERVSSRNMFNSKEDGLK